MESSDQTAARTGSRPAVFMRFVLLGAVGLVLAAAAARRTLMVVTVAGWSMEPTYHDGDRVLIRRSTRLPRRGTPVVCRVDGQSGAGEGAMVIKRLAAVPGDEVPPAALAATSCRPGDRVPSGRVVLIGDHAHSYDSRRYGFASVDDIVGTVIADLRTRPRAKA